MDGDSEKMRQAIDWIESHDLPVYRPTDVCYYVEGVKLWPDTGTVQIDDHPREKQKGLAGFEQVLRREGILRRASPRKALTMQIDASDNSDH